MRHHGTERRTHPLQRALGLRAARPRIGDGLQLGEVGVAVAQLDLHGETGGIADALDRRRRKHDDPRLLDRRHFLVQPDDQRTQILARPARAPVLEDQIGHAGIGEARAVVERRDAGDADHLRHAGRLAGDFADLIEHLLGAVERSAVRQLHGRQQVALILDREKAGRHPRQAVDADADQNQRAITAELLL